MPLDLIGHLDAGDAVGCLGLIRHRGQIAAARGALALIGGQLVPNRHNR